MQLSNDLLLGTSYGHAHMRSGASCSSSEFDISRVIDLSASIHAHFRQAHLGRAALLLELEEFDVGYGMNVMVGLAGLLG